MAKKTDNTIWIAVLIIGAILIIGGKQGWFGNVTYITNNEIRNFLDSPNVNPIDCNLDISPNTAVVGDTVTATITDGISTYCEAYLNIEGEWVLIGSGTTDLNGRLTASADMPAPGIYILRAICDTSGNGIIDTNDCLTNEDRVTVGASDCIDTDGGDKKGVPGHVEYAGDDYYDVCIVSSTYDLLEYACIDGIVEEIPYTCEGECINTKSGGYCEEPVTYEEGDIIGSGSGTETSTGEGIAQIIELVESDNPCTLGIRFNVNWNSWNDGKYPLPDGNCFVPNYQTWQSVYVLFQDSTGVRYSGVMDAPPQKTISQDICPVYWNSANPKWGLEITPGFDDFDFPGTCEIGYTWNYEIYNCECP